MLEIVVRRALAEELTCQIVFAECIVWSAIRIHIEPSEAPTPMAIWLKLWQKADSEASHHQMCEWKDYTNVKSTPKTLHCYRPCDSERSFPAVL